MTTEILPAFDASATPAKTLTGDRSRDVYWQVNAFDAPDAFDCYVHVVLRVGHHRGQYTATLDTASANFDNGGHIEALGLGRLRRPVVVATLPAARFNRAKFDAFVTLAVDTVVTTYGASA